jgi:predicted acylesterase/phospholipase RssA
MEQPARRLALSLSGGGFRATLFHLGVIRFLFESKLLENVRWVGGVSGGSIMAAHLVLYWGRYAGDRGGFDQASQQLLKFIRSDMRGRILRRWLLAWIGPVRLLARGKFTLARLLQNEYDRLFSGATLGDFGKAGPDAPQVFLYATSMSTGADCKFGRSGFMWHEEADSDESSVKAPHLPIAYAVAASSAFPPLFPPVKISNLELGCGEREFRSPHLLTDGGVYDNLGIDRFLWYQHTKSRDIDVFLVSDAEAKFDWRLRDSFRQPLGRNVRASDLLMKRIGHLTYQLTEKSGDKIVKILLGKEIADPRNPNLLSPAVQRSLGTVRTDLDAFSPLEIRLLIQHGFAMAREAAIESGLIDANDAPNYRWQPLPRVSPTEPAPLVPDRTMIRFRTGVVLILVLLTWLGLALGLVLRLIL